MAYKIEVRRLAALEILEAYDWYEEQQNGLGAAFLEDLDSFYQSLLDNPLVYSYYKEPVRQGRLARFPYLVVYELFDVTIVIYSIFMSRKDPNTKRSG